MSNENESTLGYRSGNNHRLNLIITEGGVRGHDDYEVLSPSDEVIGIVRRIWPADIWLVLEPKNISSLAKSSKAIVNILVSKVVK